MSMTYSNTHSSVDADRAHVPAYARVSSRRAARRGVAVVAVDQDDHHREHDQLQERPEHVDRWQELDEVMVIGAG